MPMHSRADTLTCAHDRSATPGLRSSRSPDSVVDAHAVSRCTSRPNAVAAFGCEQLLLRLVASARPRRRCESCSGTGSSAAPSAERTAARGAAHRRVRRPAGADRDRRVGVAVRSSRSTPRPASSSDTARTIAGTRYASDLPVPVPACTARCSPVSKACATAVGHLHLAAAFAAAERGHRGGQQLRDGRAVRRTWTPACRSAGVGPGCASSVSPGRRATTSDPPTAGFASPSPPARAPRPELPCQVDHRSAAADQRHGQHPRRLGGAGRMAGRDARPPR